MKYKLESIHFNRGVKYPEKIPVIVVAIETSNPKTGAKYIQARVFLETRKTIETAKIMLECGLALRDFMDGKPRHGWQFQ